MISKIILVLIHNYRGTNEYNNNKKDIDDLENLQLNRIKNILSKLKDFNLNYEDITNKKIEEIYIEIIIDLIINKINDNKYTNRTNKTNNSNNINNIIMQLDLENINITKKMYDKLASILKEDNDNMRKYIISDKNNLNDDIINFYYILFKYILKKSIYIFQIQFLDEIRKTILTRIKNIKEKKVDEKLKYIINFIANRYYTSLLNKLNTKKGKIKSKYDDKTTTKVKSVSSPSIQTTSSSFDNDNNSIIKFEKHIEISNMENYTRLIREMSNGDIIGLHNINDITIYKKGKEEAKIIKFNSLSSSQKEMMTNCNTRNKINLEELNNNLTLQKNKSINNIIEAKESIAKKDKNSIQVAICSKEGLMIYKISDNQKIIIGTLKLSCTGCFEIKNNNYIVIGEKGIYHFEDLNPTNLDNFRIRDLPFRGCIKINDDYIALASNSILPNGEDNLYIYDTNKKRLIKNICYSLAVGVNGLVLMDVLDNNNNQKETLFDDIFGKKIFIIILIYLKSSLLFLLFANNECRHRII